MSLLLDVQRWTHLCIIITNIQYNLSVLYPLLSRLQLSSFLEKSHLLKCVDRIFCHFNERHWFDSYLFFFYYNDIFSHLSVLRRFSSILGEFTHYIIFFIDYAHNNVYKLLVWRWYFFISFVLNFFSQGW